MYLGGIGTDMDIEKVFDYMKYAVMNLSQFLKWVQFMEKSFHEHEHMITKILKKHLMLCTSRKFRIAGRDNLKHLKQNL